MPRKRQQKKAPPAVASIPNASSFDCSACTFKSANMKTSTNHILRVHYGQARINDSTPLSDNERITGFINAQKLLKMLKCSLCEKVFRSGLGYKFHQEICGKDESELYRECEVCGKKLKISSLQQHVKTLHMSNSKDEFIDASMLMEQMTAKCATLSSGTLGRGSKRSSAIRALENFKELSDDEDRAEGTSASNKKRLRKASSDGEGGDDDDFFDATADGELEEDEESEEDYDESDDYQDSGGSDYEESEEELDETEIVNICIQDIDNLLLLLKPYIKRKEVKTVTENRPFSEELQTLEQEGGENRLPYKCYNVGCQRFFNYRIDMENHYTKCCWVPFLFVCAAEESCSFAAKQLSMDIFEHFFADHRVLIPEGNQIAKWMAAEEARASRRRNVVRPSRPQGGRKRKPYSGKSVSKWKAEYADYGEELRWEKQFAYSKEWIFYLRLNEGPTYRCLGPLKKHWKMLLRSPVITSLSSTIPRFKLTRSMEQGTDNDFKLVAPLHSARNEDSFTFNVGQFVCSAAWAPIPLPTVSTADDENEEKPNSAKFNDLLKLSQTLPIGQKRQYLAVATSSYFDNVMNIQPMDTDAADQPSLTPENSLQLWDMGPLASSNGGSKAEANDASVWTPKMALNVVHKWGDIAEMAWCPCGSTYEVPPTDEEEKEGEENGQNSQRMRRLGLLALACEDGKVRIVSMPHPRQLSSSYDSKVCWSLEPVAVLGSRFQTSTSSVTSISWAGQWPQDQLLGGFADGTIALWSLDSLARCTAAEGGKSGCPDHDEGRMQKVVVPKRIWCSGRRHPVLTIKWLNPMTFITLQSDSCWMWNLRFDRPCHELQRNVVQKVETHPLWYNTLIVSDSTINKPNSMLIMKTFCSDEIFEGDTTTVGGGVEALKHHTVANMGRIRCNDLSISPWQYLLAFCCENGELFTTSLLPKPFLYSKNIVSHLLYKIRLGGLSFEKIDAQLKDGGGENLDASNKASSKESPSKAKSLKLSALGSKGEKKKRNQLINGVVDLAESYDDFFLKYCLIFDDAKKVFFGSGRASDRNKKATTCAPTSDYYLTKNDLVRPYAITNCIWNPNLPAYSWLFTATKSGICRLVSYSLVNPQSNSHC